VSDAAVVGDRHILGDLAVEKAQLLDGVLRNFHVLPGRPGPSGDPPVRIYRATIQPTLQPLGPSLLRLDPLQEVSDLGLDPLDSELVRLVPEGDDLFVVSVGRLYRQTLIVGKHREGARDMDSSQSQEFVAVAAGEEHAERALVPGLLEGRYGDAEGGCERVPELGDGPVKLGVEGWGLGSRTGEVRREFPHSYVDVVEASLGEDAELDRLGDGLRVLEGHGLGFHTDGHHHGAEGLLRSDVGEAKWHDSGERQPSSFEVYFDVSEDAVPGGRDGMAVDALTGRNSRRKGWALGPSWRFGQAEPVLTMKGWPLSRPWVSV